MCLRVRHSRLLSEPGEAGPAESTGGAASPPPCNAAAEETAIIVCAQCVTTVGTAQPSGTLYGPANHGKGIHMVKLHSHSQNNALPMAGPLPWASTSVPPAPLCSPSLNWDHPKPWQLVWGHHSAHTHRFYMFALENNSPGMISNQTPQKSKQINPT